MKDKPKLNEKPEKLNGNLTKQKKGPIFRCNRCGKTLRDHTTGKPISNVEGRSILCFNGRHEEWVAGRSPKPENRVNPIKEPHLNPMWDVGSEGHE